MNKKEMAISFLHLASSGNVREAYETYVHPQFRHHNPYVPGDRTSLLAAMEENAATFPKKEFEAVRALEDGDLLAVHGRVRLTPSSPWIALIHIFRFQDNQMMNDNISSRYRQLELPVRKENSVGIHQRKSEQLVYLTRHADDSFSLRNQELAPCFVMGGSCQWRGMKTARTHGGDGGQASAFRSTEEVVGGPGGSRDEMRRMRAGLLSRWGWHGGGEGTAGTSSQKAWRSNAKSS